MAICIYIHTCISVYIYIYIHRCIYIYIYVHRLSIILPNLVLTCPMILKLGLSALSQLFTIPHQNLNSSGTRNGKFFLGSLLSFGSTSGNSGTIRTNGTSVTNGTNGTSGSTSGTRSSASNSKKTTPGDFNFRPTSLKLTAQWSNGPGEAIKIPNSTPGTR